MNPRLIVVTVMMCLALIFASSVMHLSNAGLGAADFPVSYGVIAGGGSATAMNAGSAGTARGAIMPHGVVDRVHRGIANILQILIIAVIFIAVLRRRSGERQPLLVPMLGLIVSLGLAFLGAWYGSPLRYPWIMMLNLTGGMALLALYWWLTLEIYALAPGSEGAGKIRNLAVAALLLLIVNIILGAWTDAYYAATACMSLPDCQGKWLPGTQLWNGLSMLGMLDVDAHGRVVIDQAVAADIHMAHRIGSLAAFAVTAWLAIRAWCVGHRFRMLGGLLLLLLLIETVSGVATVIGGLSITLVVGHNLLAALLIINILTLIHGSRAGYESGSAQTA